MEPENLTSHGHGAQPRARHAWLEVKEFVGHVYSKSADDNIFFLAAGITFNTLLAAIPLLLLIVAIAGALAAPEFRDIQAPATDEVLRWLWEIVPVDSPSVRDQIFKQVSDIADNAPSIGIVSGIVFIWLSTRLFGALRTALSEVFDVRDGRGILKGKLDDIRLVLISTVLLTINIGISSTVFGLGVAGLSRFGFQAGVARGIAGWTVAFVFIFLMYLLIYKFVPATRPRWVTAIVAALFAALGFELLKAAFGWYLANFADYSVVFFAFTTLIVVVIAAYYSSVLFVLGGEVAQEYQLRRAMRVQRETFD